MIGVRFTSPVAPGDELETQAWEIGPGPNGTVEVAFITKDVTTGKVSGHACASDLQGMTHSVITFVSGCIE